MEDKKMGRVCVTGGTGFVASWLIMKLLQKGYSVNTTIRTIKVSVLYFELLPHLPNKTHPILPHIPGCQRDLSHLTSQPGALERLQIFEANLDQPGSFAPAINGCIGFFHVAHPMEWDEKETEEAKTARVINGLLGILRACLDAKTVKRFVYTSSATSVVFNGENSDYLDEDTWTDLDFFRSLGLYGESYVIIKTLAEKTALEFGQKHKLDVVTLIPAWITGPYLGSRCPYSVKMSLALIFGDQESYKYLLTASFAHVEDVAAAHIHVFEYPQAKGRYICSAVEVSIDTLCELLSIRYPEYQIPTAESLKGISPIKISGLSSKKLKDIGFKINMVSRRCLMEPFGVAKRIAFSSSASTC